MQWMGGAMMAFGALHVFAYIFAIEGTDPHPWQRRLLTVLGTNFGLFFIAAGVAAWLEWNPRICP